MLKIAVCFGIGILFYDNIWVGGFLLLFLPFYQKKAEKSKEKKELKKFSLQFKDALQSLSGALEAGYSVENAWRVTGEELLLLYPYESEIVQEFEFMKRQMETNRTIEEILSEFSERRKIEEVESFVEVFITAKRTKGDIIKIIKTTSNTIRQKIETTQEISTIISGKRYEASFMKLVPSMILIYFRFCSPGYLEIFYKNIAGILLMTVFLIINFAAAVWAEKIISIEV